MIKKGITLVALVALLATTSCKKEEGSAVVKLDDKNMVIAQDKVTGEVTQVEKKKLNPEDYPKMEIENANFDFGTIKEGDKVEHVFKFKNVGNEDLVVAHAQASCGCTVPEWTKEPIKKGESGEIKIVFNSAGKPGEQKKTVTLTTNTESGHEMIHFKANVTPKAK